MIIYITVNDKNIVESYAIQLSQNHIPIKNGIIVETSLDLEVVSIVGNYKIENDVLIELPDDEKIKPKPLPDKTAVLESKVKELEQQLAMSTVESTMAMAQMQENSNNAVAELTMAMAMLGTGGAANV